MLFDVYFVKPFVSLSFILGGFYDESRLVPLVQRIASLDWRSLANKWHLSVEMAVHLSCLSLYDVAMYIDDSGSMSFEESGTRIADMAMIMEKVAGTQYSVC